MLESAEQWRPMHRNPHQMRGWLIDIALGGLGGGLAAAVAVWNLFIFSGIESGYESSLSDAFAENAFVGLLAVCLLVVGPVAGVFLARRRRFRSGPSSG